MRCLPLRDTAICNTGPEHSCRADLSPTLVQTYSTLTVFSHKTIFQQTQTIINCILGINRIPICFVMLCHALFCNLFQRSLYDIKKAPKSLSTFLKNDRALKPFKEKAKKSRERRQQVPSTTVKRKGCLNVKPTSTSKLQPHSHTLILSTPLEMQIGDYPRALPFSSRNSSCICSIFWK